MDTKTSAGRIVVWSAAASQIDLCLFADAHATVETERLSLTHDGARWTAGDLVLPHGQLYALRANGPASIETRARFHPERLLLDPRARAIGRPPSPLDPLGLGVGGDAALALDGPGAAPDGDRHVPTAGPGSTGGVDLADWVARGSALGGTRNTLGAGFAAKFGELIGRCRADGAVTLQLPVSERSEGDTRANAH